MTTNEETEALERALAEATRDVNSLENSALSLMNENSNDELTKQIADSILNQDLGSPGSLHGEMSDDLGSDNLQDLANISTADLKNISQSLSTSVLSCALGHDVPNPVVNHQQQQQSAILAIHRHNQLLGHSQGNHLLGQHQTQLQGQAPISVIQAQLAQAPLNQGHFQIQMPGAIAALGGTAFTINSQGALVPSMRDNPQSHRQLSVEQGATTPTTPQQTNFNCNGSNLLPPHFNNLLSNAVSTQVATGLPGTTVVTASQTQPTPAIWGQAGQNQQGQSVTFQGQSGQLQTAGHGHGQFPVMQAAFASQGIGQGGVKVAYPLQAFLHGDLGNLNMIATQSLDQALSINLASQSLPTSQQQASSINNKQQPPNT